MPDKPLPDFTAEWIQQWKQAAPRLQAIRDEELRRRGQQTGNRLRQAKGQPLVLDRYPERHGMVTMQKWFMRLHLLQQVNLYSQDQ